MRHAKVFTTFAISSPRPFSQTKLKWSFERIETWMGSLMLVGTLHKLQAKLRQVEVHSNSFL